MLKNKSKLVALILIAILLFFVPMSFADDGTNIAPISEGQSTSDTGSGEVENPNQPAENKMKKSDVYLIEDDIIIDYVIDGNAFLLGKNVTINSQIGGDVFVCADTLTIGEQGAVYSNIFAAANTIDIKGIAYDIYTISQNVTISGYIYRDIKVACGNLNLFGRVARNAFVTCDTINFVSENTGTNSEEVSPVTSYGSINGNLEYSSLNELSIPENSVMGETKFTQIQPTTDSNTIQTYLISLGTFLVTTTIIWLLCLWLTPKFLEKTAELASKKILPIIGFGLLGLLVTPILFIILLMIELTSTIAIILLILYIILIVLSSSIVAISVANSIAKKLKINKIIGTLGIVLLSSIVLWLLELIPTVGAILSLIYVVLGFGIVLSSLIFKNVKKDSKVKEEN